jgi:hypothetical protein
LLTSAGKEAGGRPFARRIAPSGPPGPALGLFRGPVRI